MDAGIPSEEDVRTFHYGDRVRFIGRDPEFSAGDYGIGEVDSDTVSGVLVKFDEPVGIGCYAGSDLELVTPGTSPRPGDTVPGIQAG